MLTLEISYICALLCFEILDMLSKCEELGTIIVVFGDEVAWKS
jgi:hypothetical protein